MTDVIEGSASPKTSDTGSVSPEPTGDQPGANAISESGGDNQNNNPDFATMQKEMEALKAQNKKLAEQAITDSESIAAINANKEKILREKQAKQAENGEFKALAEGLKAENDTLKENQKLFDDSQTANTAKDAEIASLTQELTNNVDKALSSLPEVEKTRIIGSPGWETKNPSEKLSYINYQVTNYGFGGSSPGGERGGATKEGDTKAGLSKPGKDGTRQAIAGIVADLRK